MSLPTPSGLLTVSDYEKAAATLLPLPTRCYFNGGAEDEVTLAENTRAFDEYTIRPFCLRYASTCSLSTSFLSHSLALPIGLAPTSFHRLAHPEGELTTVRGAKTANSLTIASSWSTTSLEDMIMSYEGRGGITSYVMNIYKDRSLTQSLVKRAEAAGYSALVVTVDTPILGRRLANWRNQLQLPPNLKVANFTVPPEWKAPNGSILTASAYVTSQLNPALTWKDIRKLVNSTILPVIVKGVLRADNAIDAINSGVKGIIVSNHGGRQVDSCPATIHALREIVEAVQGRVSVWMDGGVRNGRDIFKALALGATGVFVGRPILWGLAVATYHNRGEILVIFNKAAMKDKTIDPLTEENYKLKETQYKQQGEAGVAHVLEILKQDLERTMRLAGCPTIESIREAKDIVVHKSFFARL